MTSTPFICRSPNCLTSRILYTSPRTDMSNGLHQPWQPQNPMSPSSVQSVGPKKTPSQCSHICATLTPPTQTASGLSLGTCLDPETLKSTVQTGLVSPCTHVRRSQPPCCKETQVGRFKGTVTDLRVLWTVSPRKVTVACDLSRTAQLCPANPLDHKSGISSYCLSPEAK